MLTNAEYTRLWEDPAPNGFAQQVATPPDYNYYVIRENQYQDYLDIFRRTNTRGNRQAPNGGWYYEHPFFNGNVPIYEYTVENPNIRYILIGEAARPLNNHVLNGHGNNQDTYFYDTSHGTEGYFTRICSAFQVLNGEKAHKLFQLAMKRVVLIDIFPFAINYSPATRETLNISGITQNFWSESPQSVGDRIAAIQHDNHLKMVDKPTLAFIAPPKISHHIAEGINLHHWPTFGTGVRLGVNLLAPPIIPAGPPYDPFIKNIPSDTNLIGLHNNYALPHNKKTRGFSIQVPTYACCCYHGAGHVPHQLFIRNALGLA